MSEEDEDLKAAQEELRLFFAISPAQIAQELEEAARDEAPLAERWLAYARKIRQGAKLSPGEHTRANHLEILLAYAFSQRPGVPVEQALYQAAFACTDVLNCAIEIAANQGRLAELQDRIDSISQREGLSLDEHWPPGEGPADYQEALRESYRLADQVEDTLFAALLRRYHFLEFAALFEEDRLRFEVMRYVGERLNDRDLDLRLRKHRLSTLVEDFGPAAEELFGRVLRGHGLHFP
jgi:hypothetical protein